MDGKERGLIGRECTYDTGKHLTGVHKIRCIGADQRCFQNVGPVIRLKSVQMIKEELGAAVQDHLKYEAVVKAPRLRTTSFSKQTVTTRVFWF